MREVQSSLKYNLLACVGITRTRLVYVLPTVHQTRQSGHRFAPKTES